MPKHRISAETPSTLAFIHNPESSIAKHRSKKTNKQNSTKRVQKSKKAGPQPCLSANKVTARLDIEPDTAHQINKAHAPKSSTWQMLFLPHNNNHQHDHLNSHLITPTHGWLLLNA